MRNQSTAGIDSARGWLVVFAGFVGAFVAFGATYCFGIFFKPIALEFHASHAAMSALFSLITVLSFFLAPFTGKLADCYGARPVVAAGAVLIGAGFILAAHVHSFPLLFLTYGIGLGGAVAFTYIPAISAVGEWFKMRRDVALGVAISGIGCGTFVAAPLSARLIDRYGWRTVFDIFGVAGAALLLLCAALLLRPPIVGEKKKIDIAARVKTRVFAIQYTCLFFAGIAVFVSIVFLPIYASSIGASRVKAAELVGYIGAASVVGRLGLDALAPRFGLIRIYQTAYFILFVGLALWLMANSYTGLIAFALVMGVGYGGIAAMAPSVAASAFGIEGLGEILGILFTGFGVACLVGPPVAGVLVDLLHDVKWPAFVAAAAAVLGLLVVLLLRGYGDATSRQAEPLAAADPAGN